MRKKLIPNHKMNKRGWLKIVEAVLAVLIIFSVVLIIMAKQQVRPDLSEEIYANEIQILNLIAQDNNLRAEILQDNPTNANIKIEQHLSQSLDFLTKICDINEACNSDLTPTDREVYVKEVLITSTLEIYNPKKLRLFVWSK
jgi:hypothetical protein